MDMSKTSYHVVPSPNGGWSVRKAESERASKHFETMSDAIIWAYQISIGSKSELVIHKIDGTVLSKEFFGHSDKQSNETEPDESGHSKSENLS
jgi:hypothetical protein